MSRNLILVGVILGIIAAGLVYYRLSEVSSAQESVAFLRLKPEVSVPKGGKISGAMLATELVPENFVDLSKAAVLDSEETRTWLANRAVTQDISAGSFLLHQYFSDDPEVRFAATIDKALRAVTIAVNPVSSVGYFVEPGSRVDIIGTMTVQEVTERVVGGVAIPEFTNTVVTRTILQNITVLAVGRATSRGSYLGEVTKGYPTVTVEATPEESEKLVFAMDQTSGGLTLSLRNPANEEIVDLPSVSWADLQEDAE